jgi:hypothetical protein
MGVELGAWCLSRKEKYRLRRTFRSKTEEVTGDWRKVHDEKLHGFYSSPNIIRLIKLRIMKWAGHVACMGEKKNVYRVSGGGDEEDHLDDLGVDGSIILKLILI